MHIFYFNTLIFNFDVFYMFRTPRVYLQEDGSVYSYGAVHFTCLGISSLIGRRVCSILKHTLLQLSS
jgi:hypothetical protein